MTKIRVKTNKEYDVIIQNGGIDIAGNILSKAHAPSKAMIVCDDNVEKPYLERVSVALAKNGFCVFSHVIPSGENSKNFDVYAEILQSLENNSFLRNDVILALGGGVVGDVCGFAASTYMRGIDFVQIPTTLLAMIDSAIGGKTAIDFCGHKNLIGAFYQPCLVIVDVNVLDTLPDSEWKNGLGEGVKYAVLKGGNIEKMLLRGVNSDNVEEFVTECVKYKSEIVARDEFDGSHRKLLNLGHTIGHALEAESGYALKHGVAVAKGVRVMAEAAFRKGEIKTADYVKICDMLSSCGFYDKENIDVRSLLKYVRMDKKAQDNDSVVCVKICGTGKCTTEKMTFDDFADYLTK